MKTDSLTFRLVAWAGLWSAAALALGGWLLASLFADHVEAAFDARLYVLLDSLVAGSEAGGIGFVQPPGEPRFDQPLSGWYWQVSQAGGPVARSRSLWDQTLPLGEQEIVDGIGRRTVPGLEKKQLRVLAREVVLPGSDAAFSFEIAGSLGQSRREKRRFNRILGGSLGVLCLGLLAAMVLQVRLGLRPLRRLQRALAEIRSGRAGRLDSDFPSEIAPLAGELNVLLDHNAEVLERARTHVGNLAHGLKTPLAVLANEASTANGPLAELVGRQAEVMRRQIDHHLARARTAASGDVLGARTEVGPVAQNLARTLAKIHKHGKVAIRVDCPPGLAFRGEIQDLEEMLGNLLDNGCKWAASSVVVSAVRDGPRLRLAIEDDGPGLPEDKRAGVLQRGGRLDESVPGSGLGLAIVRDIAGLYGGGITLASAALGGLRAELDLPAAPD